MSRPRRGQKRQILSANYLNAHSSPQVGARSGRGADSGRGHRPGAPGEPGPGVPARRRSPLAVPRLLRSDGGGAARPFPSPGPRPPTSATPLRAVPGSPRKRRPSTVRRAGSPPARGTKELLPRGSGARAALLPPGSSCTHRAAGLCVRAGAGRAAGAPRSSRRRPRFTAVASPGTSRSARCPRGAPIHSQGGAGCRLRLTLLLTSTALQS